MHILILPSWYKTPANPLRGNFFTEQALALQKAGHQVGIIVPPSRFRTWHGLSQFTSNLNRKPKEFLWNTDDGFPVCVMPRWGLASIVSRRARVDLAAEAFGAYRDAYGHPEIIHAHSLLYAGFLGAKLGQRHQIPVVLTEHLSVLIRGPIWPDQRRVIRYALGQSRKVFAVSRPLADALRQFDPGVDIELIGNTVDSTFFQHTHPPERHPFRFLVIAHMGKNKGIDVLLKAFQIAFKDQDTTLTIAGGDGGEKRNLEQLAARLGISQQVSFVGQLGREEVRDLIASSHAVVSSSYVETFGVTLIEAMASGRPVVTTDSGGPSAFVNESNGLIVPPGDPEALAVAMKKLIVDYESYDGRAIRADCLAQYSEHSVIRLLEQTYSSLIS